MKRFIIASLLIIALSLATTTIVNAAPQGRCPMKVAINSQITPFELVSRAYQGAYRLQGIPGFGSFISESNYGQITAKTLVQAAIDANQLSPNLKTDGNYLNLVTTKLREIGN
jgi:hypothetical protein